MKYTTTLWRAALMLTAALVLGAAPLAVAPVRAAEPKRAAAPRQATFASAEEAVAAMVEAIRAKKLDRLVAIIGPGSRSWLLSGDKVADLAGFGKFLAAYDEKHALVPGAGGRMGLEAGKDGWPFPVPLTKSGDRWRFDTAAGREEVLARRIGRNELDTIQVMRAIADAQLDYARMDRDGDGLIEYAQKFRSTPGKKDGLYWPVQAGEPQSPLGPLAARATREGYNTEKPGDQPQPFHGYLFRILKGQGKDAPGGAYDYVVRGSMIGGFAVVAYPVNYGVSGVMTFLINQDGVVYQKDLGPETAKLAGQMTRFNPDASWTKQP